MEADFAQARDAEAEEFLVDDGWKPVEADPEAVAVELGIHADEGNGHVVETISGNGHREETDEGQQSLFSWAEFLGEEPAQSQGRNGKPKPSPLSLFEWALGNERVREKDLVGAGQ